jgi:hypothetical protein
MGNNKFNLPMVILIISTSLFCAFATNLKNYADDRMKKGKKKIPYLYYFANTLVYTVSGILISLVATLFTDNVTIWLIASGIGGFIGRKLLIFVVDILLRVFINVKNLNSDEVLKNMKFTEDSDEDKKKDDKESK